MNKSKDMFSKHKRNKDGLQRQCKECQKLTNESYRLQNPEYNKVWQKDNSQKLRIYEKLNPGNPIVKNMWNAKRRAKKLKATPSWTNTEFEQFVIEEMYALAKQRTNVTGIVHHVDHIVPLQSDLVQGLHCVSNLQILEATANIAKGNRYWPNMPDYVVEK